MLEVLKEFVKRRRYLRAPYYKALCYWRRKALAALWSDLPTSPVAKAQPEVLVFSRYGCETVGNRFIQLGLLRVLHEALPDRAVFLLSTDVDFTKRGIAQTRELLARRPKFSDLSRFICQEGIGRGRGEDWFVGGG